MKKYISSNLIMENSFIEDLKRSDSEYSEQIKGCAKVCRLRADGKQGDVSAGRYITVFTPLMWEMGEMETDECARVIASELLSLMQHLLKRKILPEDTFLVAGIGNRRICSDSVGALTVEKVNVTRHVEVVSPSLLRSAELCSLCAVECGVLGDTGIMTAEVLTGLVKTLSPTAIIAVDALAARGYDRLGRTVQISDTGISPGAGIGNRQTRIDGELLGVPIIAIGVPTVVSAATLIADVLDSKGSRGIEKKLDAVRGYFVSPKECDLLSQSASRIIADAVNIMFGVEGNIF